MKRALIIIDMQNGVFGLTKPVFGKDALIDNVRKAIEYARTHGITVVFSFHSNATFLRRDSAGYLLVPPLAVADGDIVIEKTHPDIFSNPRLEEILAEKKIGSLLVTGLISNGCVQQACKTALAKGFQVTLLQDAHSTFYAGAEKMIRRVNTEMEQLGACVILINEL